MTEVENVGKETKKHSTEKPENKPTTHTNKRIAKRLLSALSLSLIIQLKSNDVEEEVDSLTALIPGTKNENEEAKKAVGRAIEALKVLYEPEIKFFVERYSSFYPTENDIDKIMTETLKELEMFIYGYNTKYSFSFDIYITWLLFKNICLKALCTNESLKEFDRRINSLTIAELHMFAFHGNDRVLISESSEKSLSEYKANILEDLYEVGSYVGKPITEAKVKKYSKKFPKILESIVKIKEKAE
jgi:hypothetical protein